MKNKTNKFNFRASITKTKHVYIKNNQVFIKKENDNTSHKGNFTEEWLPINFQWVPVI